MERSGMAWVPPAAQLLAQSGEGRPHQEAPGGGPTATLLTTLRSEKGF